MINDLEEVQWAYLLDPTFQQVNSSGKPLTGGWLEVYIHGTRTKYYCASDFDGTLHPFKIPLDSLGSNIVLASPAHAYDVYVYNVYGNLVMSRYNVVPSTGDGAVIKDVVNITSNDGTVNVQSSDQTNWDLSIKDTTDRVEQNEQDISDIKGDIEDIQEDISGKKDKQTALTFNGGATKTIKKITQNANGEMNVEFEDIDLPPEVPNVEITSPNGTIDVQSSTDIQTNTKTFTIDVKNGDVNWINARSAGTDMGISANTTITGFIKKDGNIDIIPQYNLLPLKNEVPYLVIEELTLKTVEPGVNKCSDVQVHLFNEGISGVHAGDIVAYVRLDNSNAYTQTITVGGILYGGKTGRSRDDYGGGIYASVMNKFTDSVIESSITTTVNNISVYELTSIMTQGGGSGSNTVITSNDNSVAITETTVGDTTIYDLSVDTSGSSYTAGDAIDLTDDEISVKVNPSSGIDIVDDKLVVKVGNGLSIDPVSGVVIVNTEVSDVVETVEKLKSDLDTQITTNFDMPNISQVYDFADPNVSTLANGACMLCQSFTIPINHEFRTTTDDADTPTLFGIYAQQSFAHKIMLALYEYTYAAEGEEHGSSTYVGDTGPVNVVQGVNEFPLKNRNPSITELRSDKVYYATLYLPNAARVNGLLLAGCPGYGNQSIPAEPRLSCAVENITWDGQELDMSDPTTTLNHYQEVIIPGQPVYYQYYIGPWQSGYNERQTAPRFYMQIRNGEFNVPVVPTTPFIDLGDALPHGTANQSTIPSFQPSQSNSAFRDVTPLLNVTITSFEWIDGMQNAAGWAAANCVYDSGFANNLSGVSNSVVDLGQVVTGEYPGYAHRITFTTPITLTAGTTYRFLCGCTNGSPYFKVWLDPTDVIHVGNNGWYVVDTNVLRIDHQMGMYNKLYDNQNNHYVI